METNRKSGDEKPIQIIFYKKTKIMAQEINLSEHQLEIVKEKEVSTTLIFKKEGSSYQLMKFMVKEGKTFITGDWGNWILDRPVDIEKFPDRQYLKQKISAIPAQTNKSMQNFWFTVLMDGLELMHNTYKEGKYTVTDIV